jgi:signal transduction histidine kinase
VYVTPGRISRTRVRVRPHFAAALRIGSDDSLSEGQPITSLATSEVVRLRSRFAAREHGRAFWIALWIAAAAAELLALRPFITGPVDGIGIVFALVGGSFCVFGLLAWHRRPDNLSGALMTATGFLFFVAPVLGPLEAPLAFTVFVLLVDLWIFPFVALLLTFLTAGRLQPGFDRWLVASFALPVVVLQLAWLLTADLDDGTNLRGKNLLLAFPDGDFARVVDQLQRGSLALLSAVTVVVIVARWIRASGPRRRALLPSLGGAFALACFAALLVNDLISGTRSQALLWCAACSLVAVPAAFLAGLLRSRLARGGLAELVRELGSARGEELEQALSRTLGDPGLRVAYWLPEYGAYADAAGHPVELPDPGGELAVAPVERDGRRVAALVHDASLTDDPELLEAVTAAAGIALENAHLHAESAARLADLRASRERIVNAGDAERRRLERDLHDGAQQRLVAISLQLRLLQNRLRDDPSAEQLVTAASEELALSLAELRELARGIHPAVLEHGLCAALEGLASRSTVPASVTFGPSARLPEQVELAGYFVASEALANVAKYAQASQVTMRVWRANGLATIEIADDGVGGADDGRGSGLRGLADRVEALDGRLRVSSPPGIGTTVTAELPCAS